MSNDYRRIGQLAFCIVALLLSACFTDFAQHPELRFKHLTVEDGLSQSTVRAIFQDKAGFMWFGTDIGISKYDGNDFTVYKYDAADTAGIPSNFIIEIFEDSYGKFWVGTFYSGLSSFNREKEIFHKYVFDPNDTTSLSNNSIRAIFEDSKRNLWIGTAGGGLNLYHRDSDSFICFLHDSSSRNDIGSNYITAIAEDKKGFLWLASPEGMLTKYNPETGTGKCFYLFEDNVTDRTTTTFGQVTIDSDDNVWFATELGLYYYDQQKDKFTHFTKGPTNRHLNENAISDIEELDNGIFLIASDHGGINIYNKNTGIFIYHKHSQYDETSISNDQLYTIYKSPDGIIWIGNFHGGINIYDPGSKKFKNSTDLPLSSGLFSNGSVLTMCEDADGKIWMGYDGEGIDIYDPEKKSVRRLQWEQGKRNSIPSNSVVEIYRDRIGDIWIGTYLRGMCRYSPGTGQFTQYQYSPGNSAGIGGNNVWAIMEDSRGILWLGFQGNGLDRFDRKLNKFTHYRNDLKDSSSLVNDDVYKILEDKNGNIWIGTRNGLSRYNSTTDNFTNFVSGQNLQTGLYGNCIYDIYEDSHGNLWIGSDQALNLYHAETGSFERFLESDGLPGNAVQSIMGDLKNNLWISTNKGLTRFDTESRKFRNYDIADGLLNNEFNYVSVLHAADGKFFFGGKSGFNFFYPDSIFDNPIIPPVFITKLIVSNSLINPRANTDILDQHINFEDEITLTHNESVITFEFAALNFSNPQKNQYAYYLEGFDDEWNYIGNKHEVSYTNLNPGKYIFHVKGSNNDGIWNENDVALHINILPPWSKTWWFRLALVLFLIGLLALTYFLRLTFYKSQQQKLLVLVRERTFQLEEVAVTLEEKQEEINSQNEKLMSQRDELENHFKILAEQQKQILEQNRELDLHRNRLESLVEERTRELIQAKNRAEESDRLKSSFLANLSHEIRTPLNAILGFSSLLGEKNLNDDEREEYNRIIQGSSNTLLDLISDILDISKIEAGQLELNLQAVSLETVVSDVVEIFDLFMKRDDIGSNKPVELKVAIDDNLRKFFIIADSVRLTQILSNLINNAIKFTRQGFIEVGCSKIRDEETLEFYVKDTGIGIKIEHQQLVFERFRKVEEDKMQLHRGTGLGLAISYQLVNLMGGTMRLESAFGKGSVFYFTIPLIRTTSPGIPVRKKRGKLTAPDFSNLKILVAEDDISNFNYIEKLLRKAKADVLHAEDGGKVLSIMKSNPDVRLILMDIKMPVMDGIETLHALRAQNIQIPVIAQTAYALADEIIRLKTEGFDEYLSKPIQRENLYAIIAKVTHIDIQ